MLRCTRFVRDHLDILAIIEGLLGTLQSYQVSLTEVSPPRVILSPAGEIGLHRVSALYFPPRRPFAERWRRVPELPVVVALLASLNIYLFACKDFPCVIVPRYML